MSISISKDFDNVWLYGIGNVGPTVINEYSLDKLLPFLMTSSRLWRAVSVFIYTLFYLMNQILGGWNITQIKDVGSSLVHKSKWWEESKHQSEKHPVMDNVVVLDESDDLCALLAWNSGEV